MYLNLNLLFCFISLPGWQKRFEDQKTKNPLSVNPAFYIRPILIFLKETIFYKLSLAFYKPLLYSIGHYLSQTG